jgi:hypothetical protein
MAAKARVAPIAAAIQSTPSDAVTAVGVGAALGSRAFCPAECSVIRGTG